jgi:molybdopterin-guanine dinucleotide biosynthesis protein A
MKLSPLSGVVLAGGQSRRLGQNKALLRLWGPQGPTLLEQIVSLLSKLCNEVLVVSDGPHEWAEFSGRIIYDLYPGGGALGGIYTGLTEAEYPYALAVGCDMPFLNEALLRYMAALPRNYDVLIPRRPSPGSPDTLLVEPLHAVYGRRCLEPMRCLLEQGRRQIVRFFPQVRVRYVEPAELDRFDPAGLSFRNINTPEDLDAALGVIHSAS